MAAKIISQIRLRFRHAKLQGNGVPDKETGSCRGIIIIITTTMDINVTIDAKGLLDFGVRNHRPLLERRGATALEDSQPLRPKPQQPHT
ncbi:hypothetical protein F511_16738 [Dorcoceras hygrometricum]|uniref:Uncharacterized protein n=1 Tax=Dorcoceras hygrometricum TaxID=472368 RepID=A0A2Z7B325_9LAMI|nr:hypothetical protein F511_16738 [Dorcoceras hygrometricum]